MTGRNRPQKNPVLIATNIGIRTLINGFTLGKDASPPDLYQGSLILTCFMRLGARPVKRATQRDTFVSGKWCNAAGRVPRRTEGREKFATGCVAVRLWYTYHGANRSCPVTNFSPVKQVNINVPWY